MHDEPAVNLIDKPLVDTPRRAAVVFIFITILLDMLALGMIMPILPKLVESFVNNDTAAAVLPGAPFILASALLMLALLIAFPVLSAVHRNELAPASMKR